MSLYNNATPGHCVLCGTQCRRDLCRECRNQYLQADGTLPQWLKTLHNYQQRQHRTEARNRKAVQRGQPVKPATGRPQQGGVEFVSYEQLYRV